MKGRFENQNYYFLYVDIEISSYQGGVLKGTCKGQNILKMFKEFANWKVWVAIKTNKVKFYLDKVYRASDVFENVYKMVERIKL